MKYYKMEVKEKEANLYIFGQITSYPWRDKDRDGYSVVKELQELEADTVHVYINSLGGSVPEGLAIYNVLKNHNAKVITHCMGFACSAASVIFMAGDERIMQESSLLMIHNAYVFWTGGNAEELRKEADDLEKITEASVKAYLRRTNLSEEEVKEKMNAETWISAEEALEDGFATSIAEEREEGAQQSAMEMVKKKLLQKEMQQEKVFTKEEVEEIAQKAAERAVEKVTKQEEVKHSGWDVFFNGGN